MDAFDHKHYVPILFTKAGERDALKELNHAAMAGLTPLLVLPPIPWNFELDQPSKTVDDYLAKLPAQLIDSWGHDDAFIDAFYVQNELMADGRHPIEWMVQESANAGLSLVPVVSPLHASDYVAAVAKLINQGDTAEICVRVQVTDWPVLGRQGIVYDLLSQLSVAITDTHLILDLGAETGPAAQYTVSSALSQLWQGDDWKTVTVAATAMPEKLPDGRGLHSITRQEWLNYVGLAATGPAFRLPTFGDYGIAHPDPLADIDPRLIQISAKLKYTCDSKWLLARGGLFKGNAGKSGGGEEIRPAAASLVASSEFTNGHCGAENWILRASRTGPTGAPRTWVKIGTWQHLLRVLDQLEQMP